MVTWRPMNWFELAEKWDAAIRRGDTLLAIEGISAALRASPEGPFHRVLALDFTNEPEQIAQFFDAFVRIKGPEIGALYIEMNAFDINPERWFFNVFGYAAYGGADDRDWLSRWDFSTRRDVTLTGLEELAGLYASPAFGDPRFRDERGVCSLLVVAKFQDLIRRSVPFMRELRVPLLATAHDYEFIAQIGAPSSSSPVAAPARPELRAPREGVEAPSLFPRVAAWLADNPVLAMHGAAVLVNAGEHETNGGLERDARGLCATLDLLLMGTAPEHRGAEPRWEDGIRDIRRERVFLIPAEAMDDADRAVSFLEGWSSTLPRAIDQRFARDIDFLVPSDLLLTDVLLQAGPETQEDFAAACAARWHLAS
jgi:hypothetical protein